jgi:small subunit ribosomal protein S5
MIDKNTTTTSPTTSSFPPRRSTSDRRPRPAGGKTFGDRIKDVDQKIIDIRRVTRVVAGGRRMSFAVSMIIGDKNGIVGIGTGKGGDTALAIAKALKDAKKNAIKIKKTDTQSISTDVRAKYCSSEIMMFPNKGKGLVAGASVRDILVIAGVRDVSSKVLSGSKNKLNTARAVIKALGAISVKHSFNAPKLLPDAEVITTKE